MTEEVKGEEKTSIGEQTPTESPTEEKKQEEQTSEQKLAESTEEAPKTPQEKAQEEWDKQPASAELGETSSQEETEKDKAEADKKLEGIAKEKERVQVKADKVQQELDDLKGLRKETSDLEVEKQELIEQQVEETPDSVIDDKVSDAVYRTEFYSARPDFYSGVEGEKNKTLVEEYVKAHFKKSSNNARQMAHQHIFGEFEKDSIVRQAKTDQTKKMIEGDIASTGSISGGTEVSVKPPRKRILPIPKQPKDWYE